MTEPVRILSLDGGGVRGLSSARIVAHIESEILADTPCREYFHLLAGTSTGGIIAAGLACEELSAAVLADNYRTDAPLILPRTNTAVRLLTSQPRPRAFDSMLAAYIGKTRLRDAAVPLILTAFDQRHDDAVVFSSDAARAHGDPLTLRDAIVATTAAPTYLPAHTLTWLGREGTFIDGGLFANDPGLHAMQAARELFPGRPIRMLSIGTGVARLLPSATRSSLGRKIAGKALNLTLGTTERRTPVGELKEIVSMLMAASSSSVTQLVSKQLGDDLLRVEPEYEFKVPQLDDSDPQTLDRIDAAAEVAIEQHSTAIRKFLLV